MRCRRCQLILAALARAMFTALRGRGAQARTTAAGGCTNRDPSNAAAPDRDGHEC
jgi:hypothetical protein